MNALILLGVFVLLFAIFQSIAVAIGFVTDVMLPKWSMLIFLATTAAAVATAWPLALRLTRNFVDEPISAKTNTTAT